MFGKRETFFDHYPRVAQEIFGAQSGQFDDGAISGAGAASFHESSTVREILTGAVTEVEGDHGRKAYVWKIVSQVAVTAYRREDDSYTTLSFSTARLNDIARPGSVFCMSEAYCPRRRKRNQPGCTSLKMNCVSNAAIEQPQRHDVVDSRGMILGRPNSWQKCWLFRGSAAENVGR